MKNRATVWLADGVEELEAVTVIDVLRRGGVEVYGMAVGARLGVRGSRGVTLQADSPWNDGWIASSGLLVVPGGMGGMEALRADNRVIRHIAEANREKRIVAAICAGPLVLARAGVLAGRRAVCYPGLDGELDAAVYVSGASTVRDDNVVTSAGPGTAMDFALNLVYVMSGSAVAEKTAAGLLFPFHPAGNAENE